VCFEKWENILQEQGAAEILTEANLVVESATPG